MFNLFPRNEDVLCIDVGFRNIKVVEVSKEKDSRILVKKFALAATPSGAIANGSIRQTAKVADVIKKLISQQKMKAKSAKIIMSGTNIITHIYLINKELNTDLNTAVMRAVNYHLPFVGNDYKVEYKVLETIKKDNKEMCRVFVTAVPYVVIRSYVEVLKQLGLKALSIDIPSNSTAKLFSKVKSGNPVTGIKDQEDHPTFAVIDFGSETTILNVLENWILTFNKVLLSGSSNIDEYLAKNLGVGLEEAERLKITYGLKVPEGVSANECIRTVKSINEYIEGYSKRILACLDEYRKDSNGKEISKIFITGGGSQLHGFTEYLSSKLQLPVHPIYSVDLQGIIMSDGIEKTKLVFMANSLGISI
ncbi:MAG: pilus assembly protein PilM [Clostridia bacterium]|nr:pilus assembly protein PilM [Clostridia bacterium]